MDGLRRRWLIIFVLAGLIVAGSFYDHWRKTAPPEKPSPAAAGQPAADGRPAVYVSGAVNKPGVYKVGPGSRVADAVEAAGGFAPGADTAKVNLAQPVRDGLQVNVPAARATGPAHGSAAGAATGPAAGTRAAGDKETAGAEAGKISINAAGRDELAGLPGIGPVLAERIVEYRRDHGPFRALTELKKVNGIGEGKFNRLKDRITL